MPHDMQRWWTHWLCIYFCVLGWQKCEDLQIESMADDAITRDSNGGLVSLVYIYGYLACDCTYYSSLCCDQLLIISFNLWFIFLEQFRGIIFKIKSVRNIIIIVTYNCMFYFIGSSARTMW